MNLSKERRIILVKLAIIFSLLIIWIFIVMDFEVMFVNNKKSIWVHTPSVVEEGESFEITVEAWDKFERLAGGYTGEIFFKLESYNYTTLNGIASNADLPEKYTFTSNFIWNGLYPAYKVEGANNGLKTFKAKIYTPGIHYIVIKEGDTGYEYRSNPIIVQPKGSDFDFLYWGDLHGHTLYSDGSGLPHESYEFARDIAKLEFAALTDHSEHFPRMGDIDVFNTLAMYIQTTNEYNDPDKFVTLVAIEWTPDYVVRGDTISHGHLNVYFKGDDLPFFSTFSQRNPDVLFDFIKENTDDDFIAWTHHSLNNQFASDFAYYDEDIMTCVEIFSVHGSSEVIGKDNLFTPNVECKIEGNSIRDAWKMGRKFGLMASGDTHDGRLGHSISHTKADAYNQYPYTLSGYRLGHPYQNGLTALFASKLQRNSIFNGLQSKSCYATTWVNRHYLEFSINGTTIGDNESTLYVPNINSDRELDILVCSDGISLEENQVNEIEEVNIYKNSELWKSYEVNSPLFRTTVLDDTEIKGTSYDACIKKDGKWYIHELSNKPVNPDELNTDGFDYYYVRMIDSNHHAAWIGPIWVGIKS
ncbi:MAG: DUF3604 domain-containing protein [Promethearchaeota archaeon]